MSSQPSTGMTFALVEFGNPGLGDSCAIVPVNWLEENFCYWPTGKYAAKLQDMVQKGMKITPSHAWDRHVVTVMDIFESYSAARAKLAKAECKTDLESTDVENRGKGKRKKLKRKRHEAVSSSDSEEEVTNIEEPPSFPKISKPQQQNIEVQYEESPLFTEDLFHDHQSESLLGNFSKFCSGISSHNSPDNRQSVITSTPMLVSSSGRGEDMPSAMPLVETSNLGKMRKPGEKIQRAQLPAINVIQLPAEGYERILRTLATIKSNTNYLMDEVRTIKQQLSVSQRKDDDDAPSSHAFEEIMSMLPLKTEADISTVEGFMSDKASKDEMMKFLKSIGGYTYEDVIKRILRKVLSDDLASKYSLLGRKGKKAFCQLKLYTAIIGAAKQKTKSTESELDKAIQNWLRHASARRNHAL